MISIIIPYYNPDNSRLLGDLLERAINSAIFELKDFRPFEIIVIDDESKISPKYITDKFNADYIRLITRSHGCLGAARNTGMDNSKGDIILFLDADDYYFPTSLASCIESFERTDADLLMFGMRKCYSDKVEKVSISSHFSRMTTGDRFMQHHNLKGSSCSFIISKKLIQRHHLRFVENTFIEDEEFTSRLVFYSKRFITTSQCVYAYYQRPDSIINSNDSRDVENRSQCTLKMLRKLVEFSDLYCNEQHIGLDRKINTLALDHIRRSLRRADWKESIHIQLSKLAALGLFPLKKGRNSIRYNFYKLLSRNKIGLFILHFIETSSL